MALNQMTLETSKARSWRMGFANLFARESSKWWRSHRWWMQALIWLVILNGFVAFSLFVLPGIMEQAASTSNEELPTQAELFVEMLHGFFNISIVALPIGVIILVQGQVIKEKQTGTAAWILSKPVSRSAFILAKLLADALGILLILILLQFTIAYIQFSVVGDVALTEFVLTSILVTILVIFYQIFTLMLSVFANSQEIILGVSLGMLLGGLLLKDALAPLVGRLVLFTPWALPMTINAAAGGTTLQGDLLLPVVSTIGWTFVCLAVTFWVFRQQEL